MVPAVKKAPVQFDNAPSGRDIGAYLETFSKRFGGNAGFVLGGEFKAEPVDVIPSNVPQLDAALGVGGIPRGRIIEIYGPESTGKSTLAVQFLGRAQKLGGIGQYIDAEHALDIGYAMQLGMDPEKTIISQPDNGEQALEMAVFAVESGKVDVVVIDSVAALVPKAEIEGDMGDPQMGAQARLMSQALRKLTGATSRSKAVVIFINQIRMKIGVMFGNPETTTGGNALKFYASVRMDVRKIGQIKKGEEVVGHTTKVKIVKNKMAPPFREAEINLIYGKGFDTIGGWLDLGVEAGVIEKAGAWYSFEGERVGQGAENARDFLEQHPEVLERVRAKLGK